MIELITIMGYSKQELGPINKSYSPKITPLPPHNGHFLQSPGWTLWRGSTVLFDSHGSMKRMNRPFALRGHVTSFL